MNTRQISFTLRGMFCAKCAVDIERALAQLDGVIAAQVNLATERARVLYDPARVTALKMVSAIRSVGFDTPLENITLYAEDLVYATSARTVERSLERAEGIVQVSTDLAARRVRFEVLPEYAARGYLKRLLARLGFHVVESLSAEIWLEFTIRGSGVSILAFILSFGMISHSGVFAPAPELPSFLLLAALNALTLFGAGYSFYRRAFSALAQGGFDTSVLIAIAASAIFLGGAVLALTSSTRLQGWLAWGALIAATALTAGWFLMRGLALWVLPRFHGGTERDLFLSQNMSEG